MYSCLKIRESLYGFLSVPLQGKCTICKLKPIIQNHLLLMVLLETMKDVATNMVILGIRVARGWGR